MEDGRGFEWVVEAVPEVKVLVLGVATDDVVVEEREDVAEGFGDDNEFCLAGSDKTT